MQFTNVLTFDWWNNLSLFSTICVYRKPYQKTFVTSGEKTKYSDPTTKEKFPFDAKPLEKIITYKGTVSRDGF
jgi:hypothetical protein